MKKYIKFLSLIIVVIFITGCGKEKEFIKTCKVVSSEETSGYKLEAEYKVYGKGKIALKVETTETIISDSQENLDAYEEYFKGMYESTNEMYGGYENEVINADGKVVSKTTIDYSKVDIEKYIKDNESMKDIVDKNNNILVNSLVDIYKSLGASCKYN